MFAHLYLKLLKKYNKIIIENKKWVIIVTKGYYSVGYRYIGQFTYGYVPWEYENFNRYEDAEEFRQDCITEGCEVTEVLADPISANPKLFK